MDKTKLVMFQEGYARIIINPIPELLEKLSNSSTPYFIDPDLSLVKGISPEFWKLEAGQIVPMSEIEQQTRSNDLGLFEPFNSVIVEKIKEVPVEVIKEVQVEVVKEVPIEVIVEQIKIVTPKWAYGLILAISIESLALIWVLLR